MAFLKLLDMLKDFFVSAGTILIDHDGRIDQSNCWVCKGCA